MDNLLERRKGLARQTYEPLRQYPRHVRDSRLIYLMCSFDRAEARRQIPESFDLTPDCIGCIVFQWNPAIRMRQAHSSFYVCIEIDGQNSPDGTPGHFETGALVTPALSAHYRSEYNGRAEPGAMAFDVGKGRRNGTVTIEAGLVAKCALSAENQVQHCAGFTNYFYCGAEGGLQTNSVLCDYGLTQAELLSFELGPAAPRWLVDLKPVVQFAWSVDNLSFTLGEVQPFDPPESRSDAVQADLALLRLFSVMGRPALIVDAAGLVHHVNPAALEVVGLAVEEGRPLRIGRPEERGELLASIAATAGSEGAEAVSRALPIRREAGLPPLVARVLRPALSERTALVILTDPLKGSGPCDIEPLRLLGLTDWEARIAQQVGNGVSPQVVAAEMGLTITTTRSAMKTIYGKLSINRQAELVRLVTLLGTI